MSEPAPLAAIRRVPDLGMVALRGAPEALAPALAAEGLAMPGQRRITRAGGRRLAWMSPDEFLLMLPVAEAPAAAARLAQALAGQFALAADVSDARAVFRIEGARAREVLMKLCPVDFDALDADEMRRTRAAQVAVALWREGEGFGLFVFRSVAGYVENLLATSARPGSALFAGG